jgi:hypothetical protein
MRSLIVAVASVCMLSLAGAASKGAVPGMSSVGKPTEHSIQPRLTVSTPRYVSLNADKVRKLQHVIVRSAAQERWWMLFVGTTLIAYRLFRKHQVLFEASFLSLAHDVRPEGVSSALTRAISV